MFTRFAREVDLKRSFGPRPRGVGIQSIGMADQYQVEAGLLDQAQVEAGLLDQYQVEKGLLDQYDVAAGLLGSGLSGIGLGVLDFSNLSDSIAKEKARLAAEKAAADAAAAAKKAKETQATVGFFGQIGTSLLGLVGAIAKTEAERKAIKEAERARNLWGSLPPPPTPPSAGIGGALTMIAIVGAGGVLLYLVFRKKK